MCSINGIITKNKEKDYSTFLQIASRTMLHRGPDNSGYFIDRKNGVYLTHNRLSIVDLSQKGNQPMSNEDGSIHIIFNGEIYNYKTLKSKLRNTSRFKSKTDTEVILRLYEEKGIRAVNELSGDFAFAIYDSRKKEIFLVRDRLGVKPVYYYKDKEVFMFASEMKAFFEIN